MAGPGDAPGDGDATAALKANSGLLERPAAAVPCFWNIMRHMALNQTRQELRRLEKLRLPAASTYVHKRRAPRFAYCRCAWACHSDASGNVAY